MTLKIEIPPAESLPNSFELDFPKEKREGGERRPPGSSGAPPRKATPETQGLVRLDAGLSGVCRFARCLGAVAGGPSEPLAWSYYSENEHGRINVDMLRAVRLVEEVVGEKLVHIDAGAGTDGPAPTGLVPMLLERIEELDARNQELDARNRELRSELARVKAVLGLE